MMIFAVAEEGRKGETMVDKELIEIWRNMLKPAISSLLLKTNYEGMGEQDKEEFERDFNEILDLAQSALEDDTLFDAISREKAIGVINDGRMTKLIDADVAIDSIKRLPHVKPEQKTAFWLIRKWGDDARCSNCGHTFKDVYDMDNHDRFCRFCESKMLGLGFRGETE